ncbi:MAG TPA: R3H domain-containing nucleic acid-binding protein [Candidatus Paceibacterota bacterium]|nr:R3H domain-containing nucleic acid-binding protein [Candidatus Paceibacterota bacterium]
MNIPQEQKDKVLKLLARVTEAMRLDCQVELGEDVHEGRSMLTVSVRTPENAKFLIGKNGQNLQALEHLLRTAAAGPEHTLPYSILVDVNDYRKSRTSHAIELAKQAVNRVRNTRRAEALSPMTSYERRVVHMELASVPDVVTESIGQEPQRRIIIKPYTV